MQAFQEDASRLMLYLRPRVKEGYGERNEKLEKLGLQPFPGRKKSLKQPEKSEGAPEGSGALENSFRASQGKSRWCGENHGA
jgi:hypothetical protein